MNIQAINYRFDYLLNISITYRISHKNNWIFHKNCHQLSSQIWTSFIKVNIILFIYNKTLRIFYRTMNLKYFRNSLNRGKNQFSLPYIFSISIKIIFNKIIIICCNTPCYIFFRKLCQHLYFWFIFFHNDTFLFYVCCNFCFKRR